MSINKIYKILLLVSTVGISAGGLSDILPSADGQSSAVISSTTKQPRTEGLMQDCLAGLMQDCLAGLTKTKNKLALSTLGLFTKPTTEQYMRVYLDELTPGERVSLRNTVLSLLSTHGLFAKYLGDHKDLARLESAMPRLQCKISIKSLELHPIPLKLTLTGGASNLYTRIGGQNHRSRPF